MRNLTRKSFVLASLGLAAIPTMAISGCSGDSPWYQLGNLIALTPEKIVEELEDNQGLSYSSESFYSSSSRDYLWEGTPKDWVEASTSIQVMLYKGDTYTSMSKDELTSGEEVTGAEIYFYTDAFIDGAVESTVNNIVKKCGFSNTEVQGLDNVTQNVYTAAGRCKSKGQDGYWCVRIWGSDDERDSGVGSIGVYLGKEWADKRLSVLEEEVSSE